MPLPPRADVPIGASDQDNVEIKKHGTPPQFDFQPKDHVELGKINDGIDIERGVKLAGSRSYLLKGFVARLENAVLQYVWHKLLGKGFTPFFRASAAQGTRLDWFWLLPRGTRADLSPGEGRTSTGRHCRSATGRLPSG